MREHILNVFGDDDNHVNMEFFIYLQCIYMNEILIFIMILRTLI